MKYFAEPENLKPRRFVIEHDEKVGFYLYVYEKDRCIRDYLQDTLELAIDMALENFQVPKDSWRRSD
jgi:hypothetical protein